MYHIDFILTLVTLSKLSVGRRRGRGGNQVTAFIHMYVCVWLHTNTMYAFELAVKSLL